MITLWGGKQRFCDGITRRNFLKVGAFGAGLTLADMLRTRAAASQPVKPSRKSAIMIFLPGGPSHMDMYDLKPDAPTEYRGEFKPIKTNVPGVEICEHFPLQARMWDKLAVIRSLVAIEEHSDVLTMTGYTEGANRTAHHPSFGSVVSKLRSTANSDVPPFVSLRRHERRHRTGLSWRGAQAVHSRRPRPEQLPPGQRRQCPHGRTQEPVERVRFCSSRDRRDRDDERDGQLCPACVRHGRFRHGPPALDLTKEDPRTRDRYQGVEQFLTAATAYRGRRWLRYACNRQLGHPRQQFQDAPHSTSAGGPRRCQFDSGSARPRHGKRRDYRHVG